MAPDTRRTIHSSETALASLPLKVDWLDNEKLSLEPNEYTDPLPQERPKLLLRRPKTWSHSTKRTLIPGPLRWFQPRAAKRVEEKINIDYSGGVSTSNIRPRRADTHDSFASTVGKNSIKLLHGAKSSLRPCSGGLEDFKVFIAFI